MEYVRTKDAVWVLVDNIDKGWATHGVAQEDLMLVRTLLEATQKLEREMEIECKTVVFFRNDVYELLVEYTPDRGKITKTLVDWTDQGALKQLLRRRFIFSGFDEALTFDDMWNEICVREVKGIDSTQIVLDHCLLRPRALLNAIAHVRGVAVNCGHSIINEDGIVTGLRAYSHDLIEDVSLEIRDVAPDIENAVYLLLDSSARLSHEELLYLFSNAGLNEIFWEMQIPTQAGHLFRADVGHRSDLMPARVPR